MAITMAGYYPGSTGLRWVNEVWAKMIERAPYELGAILPNCTEYESMHGKFHLPQHANLSPSTLDTAGTTDMTDTMTFQANTETEITITPGTTDLNTSINENQAKRMQMDPQDVLRVSIEKAFAQQIDQNIATLFTGAVLGATGAYGSALDLTTILNAKARLGKNAKEYAEDGMIYFAYAHENEPAVLSSNNLISAYIRGGGDKPALTGRVVDAFGMRWLKTGNIRNSGGGYNNGMWIKRGIGVSFNIKPYVKTQEHGHGTWLLGLAEYGYAKVRDAYIANAKSNVPTL